MRLLLTVTSEEKYDLGNRARHEFDEAGGNIGRNAACTWVLPDPTNRISARHATVSHNGRGFEITDTSTNGVYVNVVDSPIGRSNSSVLANGDILYLGGFVIAVEIVEEAQEKRSRLGVGPMATAVKPDHPTVPPPAPSLLSRGSTYTNGLDSQPPLASPVIPPPRSEPPPLAPPMRGNPPAARALLGTSPSATPSMDALLGKLEELRGTSSALAVSQPALSPPRAPLSATGRPALGQGASPAAFASEVKAPAPKQPLIPHDALADLLGTIGQEKAPGTAGPAHDPLGVAASPKEWGQPGRPAGAVKAIPDSLDLDDLLGKRTPAPALSIAPATGPGVERVAAGERPSAPSSERRDVLAEPPAAEEDAPPEPPPVAPAPPAAPAPRTQPEQPERPAISAALSADLVALRRPGVAEVTGQRIIDPVAVLRQRGADVSGASRKARDPESAEREAIAAVAENLDGLKLPPGPAQGHPSREPARPVIPLAQPSPSGRAEGDAQEATQQGELFDAFWGGLGVDPAQIPTTSRAELLAEFGRALREAVDGLVPVLRARRTLKDELRIDQTRLQARENNPLKFLPSGEAVLQAAIAHKLSGFLPLPQAVREGFNDVKAHEVAAIVALEAVIKNLLARFDPSAISGPSANRLFGRGPDKARLWDQFVGLHAALCNNLEETTHKLVGEEFARAYAQQVNIIRRGSQ